MPDRRQNEGVLGELLVSRYLVENNYWVYKSLSAHNPIDIIGINDTGSILLLDAKCEAWRFDRMQTGDRSAFRKNPSRIYRVLTPKQKLLGVRMAYANTQAGTVHIVPSLNKKIPHQL
tara:strand:+ start:641 stop:994 length:354 start_codon:yes stop_codon:yes gene_type:complete